MTKLPASVVAVVLLLLPLRLSIAADPPIATSLDIAVPGAVFGVLWNPGNSKSGASVQMGYIPVRGAKDPTQPPKVQVWLLKLDGSVITQRGQPGTVSLGGPGIQYYLMFPYDPEAAVEAVALAVLIEGQYFIKALPPSEENTP